VEVVEEAWSLEAVLTPPAAPPARGRKPPAGAAAPAAPPHLKGTIAGDGKLTVDDKTPAQFGTIVAKAEGLSGYARVRVAPRIPYNPDFSKVPEGRTPAGWVNTQGKFAMRKTADGNVLVKTAT